MQRVLDRALVLLAPSSEHLVWGARRVGLLWTGLLWTSMGLWWKARYTELQWAKGGHALSEEVGGRGLGQGAEKGGAHTSGLVRPAPPE